METAEAPVSDQTIAPRNPAGANQHIGRSGDEKKDVTRPNNTRGNSATYRLSKLKRDYPDVAKRVEGKSTRQIAEEVGTNKETVRQVLSSTANKLAVDLPTEVIGKDGKQAREAALAVSTNPAREAQKERREREMDGQPADLPNVSPQRERARSGMI